MWVEILMELIFPILALVAIWGSHHTHNKRLASVLDIIANILERESPYKSGDGQQH